MAVHFKFKSAKDFDSIALDGNFIALADLKQAIVQEKNLGKGADFDLVVTNAQTGEGDWFSGKLLHCF
jgi:E3 ubiquitin-protein ligase RBBP6